MNENNEIETNDKNHKDSYYKNDDNNDNNDINQTKTSNIYYDKSKIDHKIFIDKLIDSLPIKIHYVSLVIIGVICFVSYGFFLEHIKYSTAFYYSVFYWENINITTFLVIFVAFVITGIMLSQNIFSDLSNSYSSLIFSIMISISLLLIIILQESEIYVFSFFVIALSLGILKNTTFTFILDNFSQKYRRMILILIFSSTLLGSLTSKIIKNIFENNAVDKIDSNYQIYFHLWFLLIVWCISPIFMIFFPESLRFSYFKNNSYSFSEVYVNMIDKQYLEDPCISELNLLNDTIKIIEKSKIEFGKQKNIAYNNYFNVFSFLFKKNVVIRNLFGFLLAFIQSLIYQSITEIEPYFISDVIYSNNSNFFYLEQNQWISIVMEAVNILLIFSLSLLFFYWKNKKELWISIITHSIILILVIILLSLQTNYLYFMTFIKGFSAFNFITTTIHNAEKTITISRNCYVSIVFSIECIAYLIIFLLRVNLTDYMLLIGTIFIIILIPFSFGLELYFKSEFNDEDDIGKSDLKSFKDLSNDKKKKD